MNDLEEFYAAIGSDGAEVVGRFGGNRALTTRFVIRFLADDSFPSLKDALSEGRTEDAFRGAHTLKGICLNLGFDRLQALSSQVTELLRAGDLRGAQAAFPALQAEYSNVTEAIRRFLP